MDGCVFCRIVDGTAPATIVRRWPDALAIVPLHPVTDGHVLILPTPHMEGPDQWPFTFTALASYAFEYAVAAAEDWNLILNQGPAASQTQPHLHWHYVPRREGDGLALPWTGQAVAS